MNEDKGVVEAKPKPPEVQMKKGFLNPRDLAEGMQVAQILAKSDIVPTSFRGKPENILIAMALGSDVGLSPMQSVQSIYVVNGRPSLWGDAVLGIIQSSGLLEYIQETFDPNTQTATCKVKRKGDPVEVVQTFSVDDAKKAGLLDKPGPWSQYRPRMLKMRARSWAVRDKFSDLLKGIRIREEEEDISIETTAEVESTPLRRSEIVAEPPKPSDGYVIKTDPAITVISAEERKALAELAIDKGITTEVMKGWLKKYGGVESSKDLPKDKLEAIRNLCVNGEEPEGV